MKTTSITLALSFLLAATAMAASRTVTLTANIGDGRTNTTLVIEPYETVEVLAYRVDSVSGKGSWGIMKDGVSISSGNTSNGSQRGTVVAGPAVLELSAFAGAFPQNWITVQITPETYPAQDAIVVPAGPYGAVVNLQYSTNLLDWSNVFSASHTNEPTSLFFRVRLDAASTVSGNRQPAPLFSKGVDAPK